MNITLHEILAGYSFAMGAIIASFLNVVIWRVPRGESIVSPPSHCPKCGKAIKWWRNLPIISWILLRGRCADCKARISPRYVVVETLGGVLFLLAFWKYGIYAPMAWVWIALMIVGSFIDFDCKLLPDFVTVGGMIYGFAISWLHLIFPRAHWFGVSPLNSVIGLVFGFGLLWLVRFLGGKAFKREAMGLGDVFLMGAVGSIFGVSAVLVTLILSSVFGSIAGLMAMVLSKTRFVRFTEIPYGPYICMGCLAWMFWGGEILHWYLNIFR